MYTSKDWLEEVQKKYECKSKAALARLCGITRATASQWWNEKGGGIGIDVAVKIGALLDKNPLLIIATTMYEQAHQHEKKDFWLQTFRTIERMEDDKKSGKTGKYIIWCPPPNWNEGRTRKDQQHQNHPSPQEKEGFP